MSLLKWHVFPWVQTWTISYVILYICFVLPGKDSAEGVSQRVGTAGIVGGNVRGACGVRWGLNRAVVVVEPSTRAVTAAPSSGGCRGAETGDGATVGSNGGGGSSSGPVGDSGPGSQGSCRSHSCYTLRATWTQTLPHCFAVKAGSFTDEGVAAAAGPRTFQHTWTPHPALASPEAMLSPSIHSLDGLALPARHWREGGPCP